MGSEKKVASMFILHLGGPVPIRTVKMAQSCYLLGFEYEDKTKLGRFGSEES